MPRKDGSVPRRADDITGESPLTHREKEVVAELLEGGRIASIAERLGVSPRTASNHLKSAFWKLGVHSQAELIELARANAKNLGLDAIQTDRSRREQDALEGRCRDALDRMMHRIDSVYAEPPSLDNVRAAVRNALPLDAARQRDWRDWLELQSRSVPDVGAGAVTLQAVIDLWRDSHAHQLEGLQRAGRLRGDLDLEVTLRMIGATAFGAAARLLRDDSERSVERELQMLDDFIDALSGEGSR